MAPLFTLCIRTITKTLQSEHLYRNKQQCHDRNAKFLHSNNIRKIPHIPPVSSPPWLHHGGSDWTLRDFHPECGAMLAQVSRAPGDLCPWRFPRPSYTKPRLPLSTVTNSSAARFSRRTGFLYPLQRSCDPLFAAHRSDTGSTNFSEESCGDYGGRANTSDLALTSSASLPSWLCSKPWLRLARQLTNFISMTTTQPNYALNTAG